ncbi:hypothetical protein ACFXGT_05695 [Streptomyces sp. NPDC059352]|uniref:hypothetical protein n=1 Tax=Streptomyces sp. NPDC059352 TaxID=3346810 RepID=UPI00369E0D4E
MTGFSYKPTRFTPEGVLRGALLWEGERVDATVMSILAPEHRAGQRARSLTALPAQAG